MESQIELAKSRCVLRLVPLTPDSVRLFLMLNRDMDSYRYQASL